jgi:acetyl esterase
MPRYDPGRRYAIETLDLEYRRAGQDRLLMRIYRPRGEGPFPALLDVHGGIWTYLDRTADAPLDEPLAASGLVVAAIDFRLAPKDRYPASIADVNYATRWLKAHAADLNADPRSVGGLGVSSGGHMVMLSAMRPDDPRYTTLPLPEAVGVDARLAYVVAGWPVMDPYGRYLHAQAPTPADTPTALPGPFGSAEVLRQRILRAQLDYFGNPEAMREASPRLILERREAVELPPTLLLHGTADTNVPLAMAEEFAAAYRAAGGALELEVFRDAPHFFGLHGGPDADRAVRLMKTFIARKLARRTDAS